MSIPATVIVRGSAFTMAIAFVIVTLESWGTENDDCGRDLRLYRDRRRIGRMRRGGTAERIRTLARAAPRSRRARQQSVDPYPARLHQDFYESARQLDVRDRA